MFAPNFASFPKCKNPFIYQIQKKLGISFYSVFPDFNLKIMKIENFSRIHESAVVE